MLASLIPTFGDRVAALVYIGGWALGTYIMLSALKRLSIEDRDDDDA